MRNVPVIFSGYNQRAVVAFLRVLAMNKVSDYVIIASSERDTILETNYRDKVLFVRQNKQLDKQEIFCMIDKVRQRYGNRTLVIAPTTEFLNRFLLQYRDELENRQCRIPIVEKELYEKISDKESFWELCQKAGLDVPRKINLERKFRGAYVAKPKTYAAKNGKIYSPILVLEEEEHKKFLNNYPQEEFFCQEYIKGESYYLLYYFSKNGQAYPYAQMNYAQQPHGKSILAAESSKICQEPIAENYSAFLKSLGYFGLVMVELRKREERYYMIEANPRFWGPSQLFVDAGVPFFELFLKENEVIEEIPMKKASFHSKYLWSGGWGGDLLKSGDGIWLQRGKEQLEKEWDDYRKADVYRREDTMSIFKKEELEKLYMQVSKHSGYQILPDDLSSILDQKGLSVRSRQERERLDYMIEHIDFKGKKILDIGGNTGFFTFEVLKHGAKHVDYYEGNPTHARFVALAADVLGLEKQITIYPEYNLFHKQKDKYDVILNLNVVHHLGDDFGKLERKEYAKGEMLSCINSLADYTDIMVFQMGFNWKGNPEECLFGNGTKEEMEQYLENGTKGHWKILSVGIAVSHREKISYEEKNDQNNVRMDGLGEFLNRPIFIMRSEKMR